MASTKVNVMHVSNREFVPLRCAERTPPFLSSSRVFGKFNRFFDHDSPSLVFDVQISMSNRNRMKKFSFYFSSMLLPGCFNLATCFKMVVVSTECLFSSMSYKSMDA